MAAALEVVEVKKRYGATIAADGISLTVAGGEMVGLLGPNGAGKTTTVSMIAGILRPDSGGVLIEGRRLAGDDDPLKRKIGLVTQDLALYEELTAEDNLHVFASLYGLAGKRLQEGMAAALNLVGLYERRGELVSRFSGGMKRRLNLAAALIHDPSILLLDEPTVGVDPQSRNAIFENLESLKRAGKALVYTTHYMEEAERLCDRIIIIDHGRLIASDTTQGLYRMLPAANTLVVELEHKPGPVTWLNPLRELEGVRSVDLRGELLRVGLTDLAAWAPSILGWLTGQRVPYHHVSSERANLEAVFLTLTGRTLRD